MRCPLCHSHHSTLEDFRGCHHAKWHMEHVRSRSSAFQMLLAVDECEKDFLVWMGWLLRRLADEDIVDPYIADRS